ncbi:MULTISPECIES: hypothetical protein [Thermogemmatispora]|uniref:Uncharacterized protein n=1 Tax=Thermogemmatispora tikiterensis TaxID=1825093 RepID=A0A328VLD4_9CHLR|nr:MULTISPECIES: hypothetical protein [Thermogemmatispora]MBX5452116.1 hypothetical protein [Thermogemmatispora sp.]RAQ95924.1 hypothetical protein A4R35_10290 [Thermogemmatispora tikiterensis]
MDHDLDLAALARAAFFQHQQEALERQRATQAQREQEASQQMASLVQEAQADLPRLAPLLKPGLSSFWHTPVLRFSGPPFEAFLCPACQVELRRWSLGWECRFVCHCTGPGDRELIVTVRRDDGQGETILLAALEQWRQRRQDWHGLQQQREQERKHEQEKARQQDRLCRQLLAQRLRSARRQRWLWPARISITFYQVSYVSGRDEGGLPVRQEAWCQVDRLDEAGYLIVWPASSWQAPRAIKLDPQVHLPIWERFTCSSQEELPLDLLEEEELVEPTIELVPREQALVTRRGFQLRRVSETFSPWTRRLWTRPVAWVRTLVEAAARQEGQ